MTITLAQLTDLQRVRIDLSNFPNGTAHIERSTNELFYQTVRGGVALPIAGGTGQLDDYEWAADVQNFYRASSASTEDNVTIFTVDGTWTKPAGLVAAKITVVAGGGAGGGRDSTQTASGGSGGGAGGVSVSWIDAASLGATEAVTVGAGGVGVAAANGGNGGASSFGTHVDAPGGNGGTIVNTGGTAGAAGGAATAAGTGDLAIPGAAGGSCHLDAAGLQISGYGAASIFGGGGGGNGTGVTGTGNDAAVFGSGGGGALGTASDQPGGDGAAGVVIVEQFFDQVTV